VFQTIIQKFQILVSKSGHQCGGRSHRIYDMKIYFNIPLTVMTMIFNKKKSEPEVNVKNPISPS